MGSAGARSRAISLANGPRRADFLAGTVTSAMLAPKMIAEAPIAIPMTAFTGNRYCLRR
jgi:hypothetical protein